MCLHDLESKAQYLFRDERDALRAWDPDKQDPKRDGGPGGKCSDGRWQVALINKKKKNIVWLMKSTSGVLGKDGNMSKDKHKNAASEKSPLEKISSIL